METNELKFLLKLLEFDDYRAPLSEIKLKPKISRDEQEEICRKLCDRHFLVCSYEISKFKIAAPGKFLLKQDSDGIPLTEDERKVLQASKKDAITPEETGIPVEEQQIVIQSLANRGLIEVKTKHKMIKDVWLTDRGKEYLQYEYDLNEASSVPSPELLSSYLRFLRKAFLLVSPPPSMASQTISDDKILLTIQELERQLATDNRLPIFYLREKLHPLILREELDDALQRLEQLGKIEMDSLPATSACVFTAEQIEAGIVRESGAPLFFIALT